MTPVDRAVPADDESPSLGEEDTWYPARSWCSLSAQKGSSMFGKYYINREWILSSTARRIYRGAASLSLAMFFFFCAYERFGGGVPNVDVPLVKLALFAGVLGAATTLVAMEYFWFDFDNSSGVKKVLWFCLLLLPPLGPALYCFLVYSRSDVLKAALQEEAARGNR